MIRDFTSIIASLASRGEGSLEISGKEIFIFANETGWEIATRVSSKNHPDIKEFFFYPFTLESSLAIKDYGGKGIYFVYNVQKLDRYVAFRNTLKNYLEEADSWCKIFD